MTEKAGKHKFDQTSGRKSFIQFSTGSASWQPICHARTNDRKNESDGMIKLLAQILSYSPSAMTRMTELTEGRNFSTECSSARRLPESSPGSTLSSPSRPQECYPLQALEKPRTLKPPSASSGTLANQPDLALWCPATPHHPCKLHQPTRPVDVVLSEREEVGQHLVRWASHVFSPFRVSWA